MRIAAVMLAFLWFSGIQFRPGSISGTLSSSDSAEPVRNAKVSLVKVVSGELLVRGAEPIFQSTVTDDAGAFRFVDLPPGSYVVRPGAPNSVFTGLLRVVSIVDGNHHN